MTAAYTVSHLFYITILSNPKKLKIVNLTDCTVFDLIILKS